VLEHVVDQTIKRHEYSSVPTLAELHGVMRELHPYYQDEMYVHSRPHRVEAERQRQLGLANPKSPDDYRRAWGG